MTADEAIKLAKIAFQSNKEAMTPKQRVAAFSCYQEAKKALERGSNDIAHSFALSSIANSAGFSSQAYKDAAGVEAKPEKDLAYRFSAG
jgi:hypothetical protein